MKDALSLAIATGTTILSTLTILGVVITLNNGLRADMNSLEARVDALRTEMRAEIREVHSDIGDLRDRMSRIEGLFEGYTLKNGAEGIP